MNAPEYYYDAEYRKQIIDGIIRMSDVARVNVNREKLEAMNDLQLSDEYTNMYEMYTFMINERYEAICY